MVNVLSGAIAGKGRPFAHLQSVWMARTTVTVGGIYMLAEDYGTGNDSALVTLPNNMSDAGVLANTVDIGARAAAGLLAGVVHDGGELACFVLAEESAVIGQPYRGCIEGYYVQATTTIVTATKTPRQALFPSVSQTLTDVKTGIGAPCIGRLLEDTVAGTALARVHFCGMPGGFAVGVGT